MENYGNQEICMEYDLESGCGGGNGDSGCTGRECNDTVRKRHSLKILPVGEVFTLSTGEIKKYPNN